ncbi:MAG: hypothetical protein QM689_08015 [Oscillospiraceae bacterium]
MMKHLQISYTNLRAFIQKNTTIFVILFSSLVFTTMILIYISVKLDYNAASAIAAMSDFSIVHIDNNGMLTPEEVKSRFEGYLPGKNEDASAYAVVKGEYDGDGYSLSESGRTEAQAKVLLAGEAEYLRDAQSEFGVADGHFFTDEELQSGAAICMLSSVEKAAGRFNCGGVKLTVVGAYNNSISSLMYKVIIPYQTMIANGLIPDEYIMDYHDKDITVTQLRAYVKELQDLFPELGVQTEIDLEAKNKSDRIDFQTLAMLFMLLIAIFNVAYLYMFVLQKRVKNILVLKLSGIRGAGIVRIFFGELVMILLAQMLCASVLFRLAVYPVIQKYDVAFGYGIGMRHYLFGGAVMLVLCMLATAPVVAFYGRIPPVRIRQYVKD